MTEEQREQDPFADLEDRSFIAEFWDFMRVRKKFWLAPIVLALLLLGLLFAVAAKSSVVAPFIYVL